MKGKAKKCGPCQAVKDAVEKAKKAGAGDTTARKVRALLAGAKGRKSRPGVNGMG